LRLRLRGIKELRMKGEEDRVLRALIWFIGFIELLEFVELTVVLETNALEQWGTHRG
jgi:hypothetical protein